MENASKALLMAGGVLLVMLIIGIGLFAWGKFSEFYSNEDELEYIDDVAEFNNQFFGYNRDDVHGYDIITLANKIADYNMRYSNSDDAKNNYGYNPIEMMFKMTSAQSEKLRFGTGDIPYEYGRNGIGNLKQPKPQTIPKQTLLFNKTAPYEYKQNKSKNEIESIHVAALQIENTFGGSNIASELAKGLESMILRSDTVGTEMSKGNSLTTLKHRAIANFAKITKKDLEVKTEKEVDECYTHMVQVLLGNRDYIRITGGNKVNFTGNDKITNVLLYHEYYNFKTATFKCNKMKYDPTTSRVSYIEFEFVKE